MARGKGIEGGSMLTSVRQRPDACTRHQQRCWQMRTLSRDWMTPALRLVSIGRNTP